MNRKKISIISWYGIKDVGGVERVMRVISEILSQQSDVSIIDKDYCITEFPYLAFMAEFRIGQMLLASLVARKKQQYGDLLIGNGFNAPFVNKDINFAHGNMYLLKRKLGVFPWSGSTIFEALSMHRSDLVLSISDEAKEALSLYYHVNTKRIKVLHNCVDDKMFYPMYKQNATNVTVLFVGRLEETKGFKVILEFAKYIENKDNIKMKIATPSVKNIGYFLNLVILKTRR